MTKHPTTRRLTLSPMTQLRALTFLLVAAMLAATGMVQTARAHDDERGIKVVYHADFADPRRFSAMLTSINNMVTTYKSDLIDYDIKIVFVAHGIRFVTDDPLMGTPFEEGDALAQRRENLKGRLLSLHKVHGVDLEVCDITRSEINLSRDKMYEGTAMVQSGVVRIAELQRNNYAYLKIE